MTFLKRFVRDERGATAIEYGLIAALISVAIIAVLSALGDSLTGTFKRIAACLSDPAGCG